MLPHPWYLHSILTQRNRREIIPKFIRHKDLACAVEGGSCLPHLVEENRLFWTLHPRNWATQSRILCECRFALQRDSSYHVHLSIYRLILDLFLAVSKSGEEHRPWAISVDLIEAPTHPQDQKRRDSCMPRTSCNLWKIIADYDFVKVNFFERCPLYATHGCFFLMRKVVLLARD